MYRAELTKEHHRKEFLIGNCSAPAGLSSVIRCLRSWRAVQGATSPVSLRETFIRRQLTHDFQISTRTTQVPERVCRGCQRHEG